MAKVLPWPAPNGDITANVAYAFQVAKQCNEHSGTVLRYVVRLAPINMPQRKPTVARRTES